MRKKVDSRIRTLVENGVKLRHRSLFVIVGDKGRDQVCIMHYLGMMDCFNDVDGPFSYRLSTCITCSQKLWSNLVLLFFGVTRMTYI